MVETGKLLTSKFCLKLSREYIIDIQFKSIVLVLWEETFIGSKREISDFKTKRICQIHIDKKMHFKTRQKV